MKKSLILLILLNITCLLSAQQSNDKITVYQSFEVDSLPSYPFGNDSLYNYLRSGLKDIDPQKCLGTVLVSFIVDTDGSISMIRIMRSTCPDADKLLMESVGKMSKWIPAWKNGIKVKSMVNIPVKVYMTPPPEFKKQ